MSETRITVAILCECGQVARQVMTPEQAIAHARDVESAARGLEPVEVGVVRGEG